MRRALGRSVAMAKTDPADREDGLAKVAASWTVGSWLLPGFWLTVLVLAVLFVWFWR